MVLKVDTLEGAAEIAEFLFDDSSARGQRRVYHLVESSKLPVFRLGNIICARKSTLLAHIEDQEKEAVRAV